jgi:hypothetical protein
MKKYSCYRCSRGFARKSHLDAHLDKKNSCYDEIVDNDVCDNITKDDIEKYIDESECGFCKKKFAKKSNLMKHMKKNCQVIKKKNINVDDILNKKNDSKLKQLENENNNLKKIIEQRDNNFREQIEKIINDKLMILLEGNKYGICAKNSQSSEVLKNEFPEKSKIIDETLDNKIFEKSKIIDETLDNKIFEKSKIIDETLDNKIFEKSKIKKTKKKIPKGFRLLVWQKYLGIEKGKGVCMCCEEKEITQLEFECGHIISEACGGELILNNILPICSLCNNSMGVQNLYHYKKKLFLFKGKDPKIPIPDNYNIEIKPNIHAIGTNIIKSNNNIIKSNNNIIKSNNNIIKSNNNIIKSNNNIAKPEIYGYSDYKCLKISEEDLVKILRKGFFATVDFVRTIHFNSEYSEYHNIFLEKKGNDACYVFDANKWKIINVDELINNLYKNAKLFIEKNIDAHIHKIKAFEQKSLKSWLDIKNDDKEIIVNIKNNIRDILYDNRHMVKKKIKLKKININSYF